MSENIATTSKSISRSMSHCEKAEEYYHSFVNKIQLKEGEKVLKNWFVHLDGSMIADYVVMENGKVDHRSLSDNVDNVKENYVWTYQTCPIHF